MVYRTDAQLDREIERIRNEEKCGEYPTRRKTRLTQAEIDANKKRLDQWLKDNPDAFPF